MTTNVVAQDEKNSFYLIGNIGTGKVNDTNIIPEDIDIIIKSKAKYSIYGKVGIGYYVNDYVRVNLA